MSDKKEIFSIANEVGTGIAAREDPRFVVIRMTRASSYLGSIALDRSEMRQIRDAITTWLDDTEESSADVYWVVSDSNPALNHKIRKFKGGRWDCDCGDHTHRDKQCKHIARAIDYREGYHVGGVVSDAERPRLDRGA